MATFVRTHRLIFYTALVALIFQIAFLCNLFFVIVFSTDPSPIHWIGVAIFAALSLGTLLGLTIAAGCKVQWRPQFKSWADVDKERESLVLRAMADTITLEAAKDVMTQ
jgi:hypothetical protein